jgi:hypothetical protein
MKNNTEIFFYSLLMGIKTFFIILGIEYLIIMPFLLKENNKLKKESEEQKQQIEWLNDQLVTYFKEYEAS